MATYLKEFQNYNGYTAYTADTANFIKPNVSYCVQENEVHMAPYIPPIRVTSVTLNKQSLNLNIDDSETLVATVLPIDADNKSVAWSSSDNSIATVDSNGVVSAISEGDAVITVTTVDGGLTAQCAVEVADVIHPSNVFLNRESLNLNVDDSETLVATVLPVDAADKSVTWSSSDNSIATVDSNGLVSAISEGEAVITVTTVDGGLTAQCAVEVALPDTRLVAKYRVTNTSEPTKLFYGTGGGSGSGSGSGSEPPFSAMEIDGVEQPSVESSYSFNTLGEHIVKYTLKDDTTIDSNTFYDCYSLTSVVIPSGVTNIGYEAFGYSQSLDNITFIAEVPPTIGWSCFDNTNDCPIYVPSGSVEVYKSAEGWGEYADRIQALIHPSSVALNKLDFELVVGKSETLIATVLPNDASDKSVTWSSSDSGIVTVDSNGVVSAISEGDAVISVKTDDGGFMAYCCVETVPLKTIVTAKYNVTSTTKPTILIGKTDYPYYKVCTDLFETMKIDGGYTSIVSAYTFGTLGEHTVEYTFVDKTSIGNWAFAQCSGLTSIDIPNSVTSIGGAAFNGCTSLTSVTIPDYSLTNIGNSAFRWCHNLSIIDIPNTVTSIGESVFEGCSSLTSMTIPSGVTEIEYSMFRHCSGLTNITIPSCVTSIDAGVFAQCVNLSSVTIPSGITEISALLFSGCTSLTSITIPSGVTSIGDNAFDRCSNVSSITIPSGVTEIGEYAFGGCSKVSGLTIPNGVTEINEGTFFCCSSLTSITIPNGVTSIGSSTFEGCSGLVSVKIPNSVVYIDTYQLFMGCSSLTSITIPSCVTSIDSEAFSGCSSLTSIEIPSGVTDIGYYVFKDCSGLTSITLSHKHLVPPYLGEDAFANTNNCPIYVPYSSVDTYKTAEGWSEYADRIQAMPRIYIDAWYYMVPDDPYRQTYLINGTDGIDDIDEMYLDDVKLDEVVTYVEIEEDEGEWHHAIYYLKPGITETSLSLGGYGGSLTDIYFSDGFTAINDNACCYSGNLSSVTIPNTVTSIGNWAFSNCTTLTSVDIPDSVISIGAYAFDECYNLSNITIGSGVSEIGADAFNFTPWLDEYLADSNNYYGNIAYINDVAFKAASTDISSLEFKPNTISIGGLAFNNCTSLTSIDIPSSVTYIGDSAFTSCSSLTSIDIPNSVTYIGDYAFTSCSSLTSIDIPNSVTYIGRGTFAKCVGLSSVTIPNGITEIWHELFSGCTSLTSVTIPSGVTSIGSNAFDNCISLTSIDIPSGVTSIGSGAFEYCTKLTSVTIPSSVTSISDTILKGCSKLKRITLPNTITNIGYGAFSGCSSLTSFTCLATTPPTLFAYAFTSTNACPIYVPSASVSTYKAASGWSTYSSRIRGI